MARFVVSCITVHRPIPLFLRVSCSLTRAARSIMPKRRYSNYGVARIALPKSCRTDCARDHRWVTLQRHPGYKSYTDWLALRMPHFDGLPY